MRSITNAELIAQLQKYPGDAPVRFTVTQANKNMRHSTELLLGSTLFSSAEMFDSTKKCIVDMLDGSSVRVSLKLPEDDATFGATYEVDEADNTMFFVDAPEGKQWSGIGRVICAVHVRPWPVSEIYADLIERMNTSGLEDADEDE